MMVFLLFVFIVVFVWWLFVCKKIIFFYLCVVLNVVACKIQNIFVRYCVVVQIV